MNAVTDFQPDLGNLILTETDAARYAEAKNCTFALPSELLAAPIVRAKIRAFIGAGENLMAHHGGNNDQHGIAGALRMFSRLQSPERAKFIAGAHLRTAREHRLNGMGKEAAHALEGAAHWRRAAKDLAITSEAA